MLRYSPAARWYVVVTAVFSFGAVIAIIVTAAMAASIVSELIVDPGRRSVAAQHVHLGVLAGAVVARVAMTYLHDRYAQR
ncbi:thiol reductant ABC exporter subunit CydD, partial [Streptomyces sp. SID10244]|nr:thiol reductant ABC exporter subunit CydD [Streptomyces sp. SID10244]